MKFNFIDKDIAFTFEDNQVISYVNVAASPMYDGTLSLLDGTDKGQDVVRTDVGTNDTTDTVTTVFTGIDKISTEGSDFIKHSSSLGIANDNGKLYIVNGEQGFKFMNRRSHLDKV